MEIGALEWLFNLGPAGAFLALLWVTLRFYGSSQKDATDATMALYKEVKEDCRKCQDELADERAARLAAERRVRELESKVAAFDAVRRSIAPSEAPTSLIERKGDRT